MRTVFCTYGDSRFVNSRARIAQEAAATGIFDECMVHTELIKSDPGFLMACKTQEFSTVANSSRGGGYWIWKPLVLYKTLQSLRDGDVLVYSDAGSTIPQSEEAIGRIRQFIERISDSSIGVLGCRNPYPEKDWTKGDVFSYFGTRSDPAITHSRQFSAGRMHVARKSAHSVSLYHAWWHVACVRPDLFSDSPSAAPNFEGFIENRHDASVWSLLCKIIGVDEESDWDSIPIVPTRIRC